MKKSGLALRQVFKLRWYGKIPQNEKNVLKLNQRIIEDPPVEVFTGGFFSIQWNCQIGKIFAYLFPYGQCVFPLYALKYKWPLRSHNLISRQGTIQPFESKLPHHYSPRNRFTETPLCKPGAGTNLEACIFMPKQSCLAPIITKYDTGY